MFSIEHKVKSLEAENYFAGYRDAGKFIEYCKACGNYGQVWVCPPYDFDPFERIKGFRYIHILCTKVILSDRTRHLPADAEELKILSYRIMEEARKSIDGKLLELEKQYPGSLAFYAGSCFVCRKEDCTRRQGEACAFPDRARSSLEAYGFDIAKTTSELFGIPLVWGENNTLPEYFTLVSGLFTDREIDIPDWK